MNMCGGRNLSPISPHRPVLTKPTTCKICGREPCRYLGSRICGACNEAVRRFGKLTPEARAELIDKTIAKMRRLEAAGIGLLCWLALRGERTDALARADDTPTHKPTD